MRSAAKRARLLFATLALGAALALHAQSPETTLPVGQGQEPTPAQLSEALTQVKADPNITSERSIRTLKWLDKEEKKRRNLKMPGWLQWIGGLFVWIAQGGRVLVWVIAAVLAALLIIYIVRLVRRSGLAEREERFVAPSFVRDLDIRPESLPDDVGQAARELWDRGEHRAALALLYRGLLSRLVHVHAVPIRDSSTEGDCLRLAIPLLNESRMNYASRLVRVWQQAVYGGEEIDTATVHTLSDEFSGALNPAAQPT